MRGKVAAGAVVFALIAMGAEDCADTGENKPLNNGSSEQPQDQPTEQAEEEPVAEEPSPDGEYDLGCAYELGDFGESGDPAKGYRFTAGGSLKNTGNTNIRVRVTYQWKRLGTSPKKLQKVYKVREGQERDVNVTVIASDNDIDAHQNADAECKATATILGTF